MQLHTLINNSTLAISKPVLCHRSSDRVEPACDELLNAVIDENSSDLSIGLALGKLEPSVLQIDQRLPKRFPLLHVACCEIHRALCRRDRAHGNRQSLVGELVHHLEQPSALAGTEQVSNRHAQFVEEQLACILSTPADLVKRTSNPITG